MSQNQNTPPASGMAMVDWENPDDPAVKLFVGFDVEGYVEEYELCGEGGDYSPNEQERVLLVDAIYGVVSNLHENLRKIISSKVPPASDVELAMKKAAEALRPLADAVFNDNGDMTVSIPLLSSEDCIQGYFASKRISAALTSEPAGYLGTVGDAIGKVPPSQDLVADSRPSNCRFRLRDEKKSHPRSRCTACGKTTATGLGNACSFGMPPQTRGET